MANLISDIEAFCEAHKMSPTRFGELALNDKPFIDQVKNGRRLWPETEAKVRRFMVTYQPASHDPAKPTDTRSGLEAA